MDSKTTSASSSKMDKIVSLCKRRGFIFQSSEIYGGLSSIWDYGPLGAELKRNLKTAWWKSNVHLRSDMEGLDAAILMHPKVWEASGHVQSFSDLLVDCKGCKRRYKLEDLQDKSKCPNCGGDNLTCPREFNLMFKTPIGPTENKEFVYLRPETAQGIFVNFLNVLDSRHRKIPFGVAQIGKAYRNEITPGNFTFRTREFEQMEIEYFVKPGTDEKYYREWVTERLSWYQRLGIKKENLRLREHSREELAHYALGCTDIEYNFPFGWSELEGIANRGDFDLIQHAKFSGKDLSFFDNKTKRKFIPYVIEPSGGIDRALLAFLADSYREEKVKGRLRVVLGLGKELAPIKAAVLPLLKNRAEIVELAKKITRALSKKFMTKYDDTAAIGKLYRRQDEIGTLYCITVDVETLSDNRVTVRERDSMKQERIAIDGVEEYLEEKLS